MSERRIDGIGVELPRAQDICRDNSTGPKGTHCYLGWAGALIADIDQCYAFIEFSKSNISRKYVSAWNDDRATTKQEIADTFERVWCEFFDVEAR